MGGNIASLIFVQFIPSSDLQIPLPDELPSLLNVAYTTPFDVIATLLWYALPPFIDFDQEAPPSADLYIDP